MIDTAGKRAVRAASCAKKSPAQIQREDTSTKARSRQEGFFRCESGTFTIEAVIWMPMFFALMLFAVNVSMVFLHESAIMRVVQIVSREHSLGLYRDDAEAELDLAGRLAHLGANVDIDVTKSFKMATASVKVPAADLMPMQLFRQTFSSVEIDVTSNYLVEF